MVLFLVCFCPLFFVVGVALSLAYGLLIGNKVWQVVVDPVLGRALPFVAVLILPGLQCCAPV